MAMTEAEAKTKWCPFVRYKFSALSDQVPFNRSAHETDDKHTRCIGSHCMAWRWKERYVSPQISKTPKEGWEHVGADEAATDYEIQGECWREPEAWAQERRKGSCGLCRAP